MKNSQKNPLFRQTLAANLLASGASQLAVPILAQTAPLTSAGTPISSTGTATYEDPNAPGVSINATSNTVTITVAEVAGITVTSAGVNDTNGGSVSTSDLLNFDYLITNVGNDPTRFFIPGTPQTIIGGTADTLQVVAINGVTLTTPVNLPATGFTDNATFVAAVAAQIPGFTGSFTSGGSIQVRVPVTVTATAAGNPITVQFGNTPSNTQNQPWDGTDSDDVRTADNSGTTNGDISGLPVNGEREASSSQSTTLATAITTRALATVLNTRTAVNPQTTAVTDDLITYRLDLRVESTSPNPSFTPGTLEGTTISLDGSPQTRILVSDMVPAGTAVDPTFIIPTAPAGWQPVYSTSATATPNDAINPVETQWISVPAGGTIPAGATRVGFVFTGTLAPGSTTTTNPNGFQFRVITSGLPATGGNVSNLAQSFGETLNDTANTVNYDESGDNRPNNFNDDNTTTDPTGAGGFDLAVDNGVANPGIQGTDANNNNTGTGTDGESNALAIAPPGSIFNGPLNQPGATGPGGSNQNDLTNKSATNLPANSQAPFDPNTVTFNNTVNNPGNTTLNNVVLKPIAPSQADFVADGTASNQTDRNTGFGTDADLPSGTTVTIDPDGAGSLFATYTWNGTTFNLTSGAHIVLASLGATNSLNYTVTVDLPTGIPQVLAFPVPIVSFVDTDGDSIFDRTPATSTLEPIFNLKIDREYTGYIQLLKQSQVLQGTSPDTVSAANAALNADPKTPVPSNIILYQIGYTNISTPPSAGISGSVLLNASNLAINEDGTAAPNNWAGFTTHQQATVTNPVTPVQFFNGTTPLGTTAPVTGITVTRYLNNVGTVAPSGTGTFTFQRRVN